MGLINILSWLTEKLPIQGRKERWRNELFKLEAEREELLKVNWDIKKANRHNVICKRIDELNRLCRNES